MGVKVGLALGSGGLRGLAHVGVLKIFEKYHVPIDYLAGCSIGSLIGAIYAAGLDIDSILKLAKGLKRRHWLDFIIPKRGLISGDRLLEMVSLLTKNKTFSELNIPLSIVATDIIHGQEVIFTTGNVAQAVRASTSVPGVFVPYELNGRTFVDGAVVNPTPVDVVRKMGADIVIGVDLAHEESGYSVNNIFDAILQSIDIMERELLKYRAFDCDILISPAVTHISPSSFSCIDEAVELGEQAACNVLPKIMHLLEKN